MSNIRDRLLAIKDKIHKVEVGGVVVYFKHLKSSNASTIMKMKGTDSDALIFTMCACEESGDPLFTLEEIDVVKELPQNIVTAVVTAAVMGNEKKPLGA